MNYFLLLSSIFILQSCAQNYGLLHLETTLPKTLNEVSGIATNEHLIWMINDGNNPSVVYQYNISEKRIESSHKIENAQNKDWEDLTLDDDGNLYIGDFGNNKNKRKDLVIYKTNISDFKKTEKITFKLEDQLKFPPKKKHLNFDIEAFFFYKSNLYLFSRNRSSDFDGTTTLYKLPATPGDYLARKIGAFKTCKDPSDCQITSADFHASSKTIALLSYNKVWLLSNFTEDRFFEGSIKEIKLKHSSQKEAITFKDQNTLYITDERSGPIGRNLYTLDISKIKE